jgi:transcriptional regulator with XRE-family HTH domain
MNFLASNLKILRKRKQLTQEDAAQQIGIKRVSLNSYENGIAEPPIEILIKLSNFYNLNIDTLIKVDLSKLSDIQLKELEEGYDSFIKGSKLRVLATTVNNANKENIELVPLKAQAGYTAGYNDPEFISGLPTFHLPFLAHDKKYRTFQIQGDSMLPIPDKSFVIAEYLENWYEIKDGHAYIFLTYNDGIVFKVAYNNIKKNKKILLKSLNPLYKPYEISIKEIQEVWKFVNYISSELPPEGMNMQDLVSTVLHLKNEVANLKNKY